MSGYHLGAFKKRLNAEISFHYALSFMNNVFLMATAGYYGEDPYNIYYQDKYASLRLGLSSGFLRQKIGPAQKIYAHTMPIGKRNVMREKNFRDCKTLFQHQQNHKT